MKISNILSPSFQKKLMARCFVKKADKPEPCHIYELDKIDDRQYFRELKSKKGWNSAHYLNSVNMLFKNGSSNPNRLSYYVMEDSDDKCLGYCVLNNIDSDLSYLEVKPKCTAKHDKRPVKYVGETLITFLTELLEKRNESRFTVSCMANRARDFYLEHCHFKPTDKYRTAILSKNSFSELEKQNIEHTGSQIDFVD